MRSRTSLPGLTPSSASVPSLPALLGSGQAHGKVILIGEHAVVYGRSAIAAAIDRQVRVSILAAEHEGEVGCGEGSVRDGAPFTLIISSPEESEPSPQSTLLLQAVTRAADLLDVDLRGLKLRIDSDLPAAVGLGSSAALSVALVRALAATHSRALTADNVCSLAYELERLFHGFPSGIDNTVATHGGLVLFRRDAKARSLASSRAIPLVVAIGRAPRNTSTAVGRLRARWQENPGPHEACFDRIQDLAREAGDAIESADWPLLGRCFDTNHALLQELGVSTPELDEMVDLARSHGALGAKLTGGGGGGAIVCLMDADPQQLVRVFTAAGWRAFPTVIQPTLRGDYARQEYGDDHVTGA